MVSTVLRVLTSEGCAPLVLPERHAHSSGHFCLAGVIQGPVVLHQALQHLCMAMSLALQAGGPNQA